MAADMKILIVDDEAPICSLVRDYLELQGFTQVRTADSGAAALRSLRDAAADVVILDIRMPGLSGLDVLREMRADPALAGLPVILFSTTDGPGRDQCRAMRADYVRKPVRLEELKHLVEILTERRRTDRN